jgi:entericidin A
VSDSKLTLRPRVALTLAALFAGLFVMAACNTMHGLGEDVSTLGNKISNKAEEHTN